MNGMSFLDTSTPAYSSFRLSNLGLDFGIGSDNMQVKNSAMLLQALEEEPEKVQAFFAESPVESVFDLNTNWIGNTKVLAVVDEFITSLT